MTNHVQLPRKSFYENLVPLPTWSSFKIIFVEMQPIPSQINLKSRRRKSKQREERTKINNIAFSAFSNFGSCNLAPRAKGSKVLDLQSNKLFCAASMLFGGPRNFSAIKLKWHLSTTISGMNNSKLLFPFSWETNFNFLTVVTSSPDPTPERDAILQAGLSALLRAKDTPVQTPVVRFTLPSTCNFQYYY